MENKIITTLKVNLDKFTKEHNENGKIVLKQILSKIQIFEKAKNNILISEKDTITLIQKEIKEINESIVQFAKANRIDLVNINEDKLNIINNIFGQYFPKILNELELRSILSLIIEKNNIKDIKQMGLIIKEFKEYYDNQNMQLVSTIIKDLLTNK